MWRMCHGFCWAAHLDTALCVCRSLRNKLTRVGNRSLVQQESGTWGLRRWKRHRPGRFRSAHRLFCFMQLIFMWELLVTWAFLITQLCTLMISISRKIAEISLWTSGLVTQTCVCGVLCALCTDNVSPQCDVLAQAKTITKCKISSCFQSRCFFELYQMYWKRFWPTEKKATP